MLSGGMWNGLTRAGADVLTVRKLVETGTSRALCFLSDVLPYRLWDLVFVDGAVAVQGRHPELLFVLFPVPYVLLHLFPVDELEVPVFALVVDEELFLVFGVDQAVEGGV